MARCMLWRCAVVALCIRATYDAPMPPRTTAPAAPEVVVLRGLTAEDLAAAERVLERRRADLDGTGARLSRNALLVGMLRAAIRAADTSTTDTGPADTSATDGR